MRCSNSPDTGGANATVFSLVNGVLLTPMDYDRSHELVSVAERSDTGHPNWVAWSDAYRALSGL